MNTVRAIIRRGKPSHIWPGVVRLEVNGVEINSVMSFAGGVDGLDNRVTISFTADDIDVQIMNDEEYVAWVAQQQVSPSHD